MDHCYLLTDEESVGHDLFSAITSSRCFTLNHILSRYIELATFVFAFGIFLQP